ncbi:winged helix domain-containing protein [Limimaricola variabilis]|uniref:winged helix domain-containing protein n=1 Tax=Limimaricola variabilis TaxID=1492771 RepID=UPI003898E9F3
MIVNVLLREGERPRTLRLKGRLGWTMHQLAQAGPRGLSTLERPAPRWSGYVHDLRKLGISIETEMEPHEGAYKGHHARYRLACAVEVTPVGREARK